MKNTHNLTNLTQDISKERANSNSIYISPENKKLLSIRFDTTINLMNQANRLASKVTALKYNHTGDLSSISLSDESKKFFDKQHKKFFDKFHKDFYKDLETDKDQIEKYELYKKTKWEATYIEI